MWFAGTNRSIPVSTCLHHDNAQTGSLPVQWSWTGHSGEGRLRRPSGWLFEACSPGLDFGTEVELGTSFENLLVHSAVQTSADVAGGW